MTKLTILLKNKMAFGSWFKNIINGAKNVIGKALPVLRKGAEIVSKVAPYVGNMIGGTAGSVLNKIGSYAGKVNNVSKAVGVNGAGIRQTPQTYNPGRFDIPLLK